MRVKTTLVLSLLVALLVLGFSLSAQASVTYDVNAGPLPVVQNGLAEVMGPITLTIRVPTVGANVINPGDQITITFIGAKINNSSAAAITVVSSSAVAFGATINHAIANPSVGGQLIITFADGGTGDGAGGGDTRPLSGGRASVVGRPIGFVQTTQYTAVPSNSSFFNITNPNVAQVIGNIEIHGDNADDVIGISVQQCNAAGEIAIQIDEVAREVLVQNTPAPTNFRVIDALDGNANSQVHLSVLNLQSGVVINWPEILDNKEGGPDSHLDLISFSGAGNSDAVYEYSTDDQALSDNTIEKFDLFLEVVHSGTDPETIVIPATAGLGSSTIQANMNPGKGSKSRPRFDDPLHNNASDAPAFLTIVKCVTNILFPYVASVASLGYETGLAAADTSYDVNVFNPTTTPQDGTIVFNYYPKLAAGASPAPPVTFTTDVVKGGDVYANTMGALGFSGVGYVIAVCNFQMGHGFAFIVQGGAAGFDIAEGYLGINIPDNAGARNVNFEVFGLGH